MTGSEEGGRYDPVEWENDGESLYGVPRLSNGARLGGVVCLVHPPPPSWGGLGRVEDGKNGDGTSVLEDHLEGREYGETGGSESAERYGKGSAC